MRFNDEEIYGLDLRPSYRIKKHDDAITEQEFFKESPSPEEIEKRAKKERSTILNGFNCHKLNIKNYTLQNY